jgi:UDPglucose--hexose-1-phosphate uridylyltransferase
LCPGNERVNGVRNPHYQGTYLFENDFPALLCSETDSFRDEEGLLVAHSASGLCQVLCFSPRHDLTIPQMSHLELRAVVDRWKEIFIELDEADGITHVQIFENHGALMGASNPHPHCQIWSTATLPNIPERELLACTDYRREKGSCLLCDYLYIELKQNERVVCQNDDFAAVVPFWAVWPFETLLLAKRHFAAMGDLGIREADSLADIMRRLTIRYDNLFQTSFPYSMGFHQRPSDGAPHPESHFHAHYYPPLLRSASVQKFMVGFELLDSPQRDLTPEQAAAALIASGEVHYLAGS